MIVCVDVFVMSYVLLLESLVDKLSISKSYCTSWHECTDDLFF